MSAICRIDTSDNLYLIFRKMTFSSGFNHNILQSESETRSRYLPTPTSGFAVKIFFLSRNAASFRHTYSGVISLYCSAKVYCSCFSRDIRSSRQAHDAGTPSSGIQIRGSRPGDTTTNDGTPWACMIWRAPPSLPK